MRVAVFDLDGTLADTSADLIAAANGDARRGGRRRAARSRGATGRSPSPAGGRCCGRGSRGLGRGRTRREVDRLYPRLLELYGRALAVHTRLYDGVGAALDRLAAAGWRLGDLHQQAGGAGAARWSRRSGSAGRFAVLLGADSLPWRKPDPRHLLETIARAGGVPARAVLVGDTVTDRDAARAAGVPCVLVGFGPEGPAVAALGPAAVVAHYDELPEVLERLVPK